ncbi:sugar-binding domain-containing protein [Caulobacter segnis]
MTKMTRRQLVAAGAALSAGGRLSSPARANGPDFNSASVTPGPRERLRFDSGWRFALGHGADPAKDFDFGFGQADFSKTGVVKIAKPAFDDAAWRPVDLPHDWAVELPFVQDDKGEGDAQLRSHGYRPLGRRYPETSVGWYRRTFEIANRDLGRRISIEFDGAMRDVLVFVNGCFIGRNNNGYAPFRFDLTDFLVYGGKNVIAVRVDASFGDGWFYEGAGLYRHVWLCKTDAVHLRAWETVVRSTLQDGRAALELEALAVNEDRMPVDAALQWEILDARGRVVARAEAPARVIAPGGEATYQARAVIHSPSPWALETPYLYTAVTSVVAAERRARR